MWCGFAGGHCTVNSIINWIVWCDCSNNMTTSEVHWIGGGEVTLRFLGIFFYLIVPNSGIQIESTEDDNMCRYVGRYNIQYHNSYR